MDWKRELIKDLQKTLRHNHDWLEVLNNAIVNQKTKIHLGVFSEPFLSLLLSGSKTIESRFSKNKIVPYKRISTNDIVIVKQTGGPCKGIFVVGKIWFYSHENSIDFKQIEKRFAKGICSSHVDDFWYNKASSRYITLMEVDKYLHLSDIKIAKKDRSAWSLLT